MNVIEVKGLTKDYGRGRGIFGVSFSVGRGETLGFLGPNVPRYEQKTLPIT